MCKLFFQNQSELANEINFNTRFLICGNCSSKIDQNELANEINLKILIDLWKLDFKNIQIDRIGVKNGCLIWSLQLEIKKQDI